jgi:hypothetical protein
MLDASDAGSKNNKTCSGANRIHQVNVLCSNTTYRFRENVDPGLQNRGLIPLHFSIDFGEPLLFNKLIRMAHIHPLNYSFQSRLHMGPDSAIRSADFFCSRADRQKKTPFLTWIIGNPSRRDRPCRRFGHTRLIFFELVARDVRLDSFLSTLFSPNW